MKKKSESKRFDKLGLNTKLRQGMNMKMRKPQLEALEERQMLSAVSMAGAENGISSETFYVTLSNANNLSDTSTQYVAMHVQGNVSVEDIAVMDENGTAQTILNSKVENGVTTLLLQMGFGTDYTVTVSGVSEQNQIAVLFTTPGDADTSNDGKLNPSAGNGMIDQIEYNSAYAMVLSGKGLTQRAAMMLEAQLGVSINSLQVDSLIDMDGDGKLSEAEFNTYVVNQFNSKVKIAQEIIVKPVPENIQVNGADLGLVDEEEQTYVSTIGEDGKMTISGQLPTDGSMTIQGEITITDEEGNTTTASIADMLQNDEENGYSVDENGNFSWTLEGVSQNAKVEFTLSYEGAPNSANTITIYLDSDAPTLGFEDMTLTSASQTVDSIIYSNADPVWKVTANLDAAAYAAIQEELAEKAEGIWIVFDCDGTQTEVQLTAALLAECVTGSDAEGYVFTYTFAAVENLADGNHIFKAWTHDLSGNTTAELTKEVVIDKTAPAISSNHEKNWNDTHMYVDAAAQTLTVTMTDANAKDTGVLMLNGTAVTGTFDAASNTYTYQLNLAYGENVFTFTCSDKAGNESTDTFQYIFNQVPALQDSDAVEALQGEKLHEINPERGTKDITIGNINDMFAETDGSAISADGVKLDITGDAISSWNIDADGNIHLILKDCGSETATLNSAVSVSYTDEYGKTAESTIDFTVALTNDAAAPVVEFTNSTDFAGKIDSSVLTTTGSSLTLKFDASDFNGIKSAVVTVAYETAEGTQTAQVVWAEGESGAKEVTLEGLKDGSKVTVSYVSEDEFGNAVTEALTLGEIAIDNAVAGSIETFAPEAASPTNAQPKLDFTIANHDAESLKAEISYSGTTADGQEVSGTFVSAFAVSQAEYDGVSGTALADGTYTFTIKVWDNSGNEISETVQDYVLDTTAPTVGITNTLEYTNEQNITLNFENADNLSGITELILMQNGTQIEISADAVSCDAVLAYGKNVFTLTAKDAAGNISETVTYTIDWNLKPVANAENPNLNTESSTAEKAVFDVLMSIGLKEISGEYEGKIVVDLADYVTDEETLALSGSIALTNNTAVASAEIVDGKLILTMNEVTLDQELYANIDFTLQDTYGETIAVTLNITYIYDDQAPTVKPNDFVLTGNSAVESGKYFLQNGELKLDVTISDDTAVKSYGWQLTDAAGKVLAEGEGTVAEDNVKTLAIDQITQSNLADGSYFFTIWGDDGILNESTKENPSTTYEIIVDSVNPVFEGTVTLADSTELTNKTSQTINISGSVTDANDCWIYIYDNGEKVAEQKAKEDGSFDSITLNDLADGEHAFTWQIVDAAANAALEAAQAVGTITVDTAAPEINASLIGDADIFEESGKNEKDTVKFDITTEDAHDVTVYYSTNNGTSWTEYTDAGVKVSYGETVFTFKAVDAAGNETVWAGSITVNYDHTPITQRTPADKEFALPTEGTNTFTVTYTKAEIEALFLDSDPSDTLNYTFAFTGTGIELTSQELAGDTWTLTFTITDYAAVKALHEAGSLTVTAEDSYGKSVTTEAAALTKANLAPEQVKETVLEQTQNVENPAYTFDLSEYFTDPESDAWTITSAAVLTGGESNGTCAIDGQKLTWTPASGLYGTAVLNVTVTDASGAAFSTKINVSIKWAGITSVSAESAEFAEEQENTKIEVTLGNAFDAAKAWGGYAETMTGTVTLGTETVKGYVINADGTRTSCASLFETAPVLEQAEDGKWYISFTLAENAYGSVELTPAVNGVTGEALTLTVTNVADTPRTPALDASFTLSETSQEYKLSDWAGLDTGADEGTLSLSGLTVTTEGVTFENGLLSIVKDGKTYVFATVISADGQSLTLTRQSIDGVTEGLTDTDWEALDGMRIDFNYTVTASETGTTAGSTLTLSLSAVAKSVTETVVRSEADQTITVNLSKLTDKEGWYISNIGTLPEGWSASSTNSTITITVPAYAYDDPVLTYTLSKDGETKTYTSKITIDVTDVNWAPTWADGSAADSKVSTWEQNESDGSYTLALDGVIKDVNADTAIADMTFTVENVEVTDSRTGKTTTANVTVENGTVTVTPSDKDFFGSVSFTIVVTDTAVGTAEAQSASFKFTLNVSNVNDAPFALDGADFTYTGKPGAAVNLQEQFADKFGDADGDSITVTCDGSDSVTLPNEAGVYPYTITANDGKGGTVTQDIKLIVQGEANIIDISLNETKSLDKLNSAWTVPEDIEVPETVIADTSVLKMGTLLKAGTTVVSEVSFTVAGDWSGDGIATKVFGNIWKLNVGTLASDVYLSTDGTIGISAGSSLTLAAGSILAMDSTCAANTVFTETLNYTGPVSSSTYIKKVYDSLTDSDRNNYDTLLKEKIELSVTQETLDNLEYTSAEIYLFDQNAEDCRATVTLDKIVAEIPDDVDNPSPFKYLTYEDGAFYVYYRPYDAQQDRSAQEFSITLADGNEVPIVVSVPCVQPFEVTLEFMDEAGDTISIDNMVEGGTYNLVMSMKVTLPSINKTLASSENLDPYFTSAFCMGVKNLELHLDKIDVANANDQNIKFTIDYDYNELTPKGSVVSDTLYQTALLKFTVSEGYKPSLHLIKDGATYTTMDAIREHLSLSTYTFNMVTSSIGNESCGIGVNTPKTSNNIHASQIKFMPFVAGSNAVKGTEAVKETVVQGNGIYMSAVKDKTDAEQMDSLQQSDEYLTEWDSHWVELWVNTQEIGTTISNFDLALNYNTDYFTAVDFEYSSWVANGQEVAFNDETGRVTGIGGDLTQAVTRDDGFVLLGRVKFDSVGTDNVAADTINSVSLGLSLDNVSLSDIRQNALEVNSQVYVNTQVFSIVYDSNDDGIIDVSDLVNFAKLFGQDSTKSTSTAVWAMDFDNSGSIDVSDLISFSKNFSKSREASSNIVFPNNFFQTWIGTTLKSDGDSNVADTLDTAIGAWAEKLGEDLNIDVQIIVKDYENVEGGILGETLILGCDEEGKPNQAVVYLDSDALGMGWYVGTSDDIIDDQYDLYSVLLHELGHALGMSASYEGYRSVIQNNCYMMDGQNYLVFNGHVYAEGDLMNEVIDVGTRLEISDVDAAIISQARENGGSVYASTPDAAMGAVSVQTSTGAAIPVECALETTVSGPVTLSTASAIMPLNDWNDMLVETAVQTVQRQENLLNDSAWAEIGKGEAKDLNFFADDSKTEVNLDTAGSEAAFDDLFSNDELSGMLEDIAAEKLNVKLNEDK